MELAGCTLTILDVAANAEAPDSVLCACCLVEGINPPSPLQLPFPLQLQLPTPLQLPSHAATTILLRSITSNNSKIHENFLHPFKANSIVSRILVSLLDTCTSLRSFQEKDENSRSNTSCGFNNLIDVQLRRF